MWGTSILSVETWLVVAPLGPDRAGMVWLEWAAEYASSVSVWQGKTVQRLLQDWLWGSTLVLKRCRQLM